MLNVSDSLRVLSERMGLARTTPDAARVHLDAAIAWLAHAQDATPDDGVSQTFLVRRRHWAASYPETTGYIIPTLYRYAHLSGDADARARALRMAHWECEVQHASGGVLAGALGDSTEPTIFNTGQVLFGWVRAYEEEHDARFLDSARRAARWLCEVQDADGCWRRFASPMTGKQPNVYNTRSAWGLARVHQITGEQAFLDAAVGNCEWALGERQPSGWLAHNCLQDDRQPFVHTIAYAMRGLLEVGAYAQREDFLAAAVTIGDALLRALPDDGALPGRFDANWQPTVRWSCLTGDAQIAINWGRLARITGEARFSDAVPRINRFVKSTQRLHGDPEQRGGIKGSHPINGGYHPWQYPNWAAKFFADALMMEMALAGECDVY